MDRIILLFGNLVRRDGYSFRRVRHIGARCLCLGRMFTLDVTLRLGLQAV